MTFLRNKKKLKKIVQEEIDMYVKNEYFHNYESYIFIYAGLLLNFNKIFIKIFN